VCQNQLNLTTFKIVGYLLDLSVIVLPDSKAVFGRIPQCNYLVFFTYPVLDVVPGGE